MPAKKTLAQPSIALIDFCSSGYCEASRSAANIIFLLPRGSADASFRAG